MKTKVLIVEDDIATKEVVFDTLEPSGYQLFYAENGQKAIDMVYENKPDIILLDMNMPVMNGLEFLQQIKLKRTDPYAVIAMTGDKDYKSVKKAYEIGVTNFLHKPFNIYELLGAIENANNLKKYTKNLENIINDKTKELNQKISSLEKTQKALNYQKEIEGFIATLSTVFLRLKPEKARNITQKAINKISEKIGAEIACIYFAKDGLTSGADEEIYYYPKQIDYSFYPDILPWLRFKFTTDNTVFLPDLSQNKPQDNDIANILTSNNVKSFIAFEMRSGNEFKGFISFTTNKKIATFWKDILATLRMVGDLFVNLSERLKSEKNVIELLNIKEHFIAAISHELRTPLSIIQEGVSLLSDTTAIEDENHEIISLVTQSVDRLGNLIQKILDYRQLEGNEAKLNPYMNNINDLITDLLPSFKKMIEDKNVELKLDLDENISPSSFDRSWIAKAISNLVSNACRFTEKGYVTIHTRQYNNKIGVVIEDTGCGIEPQNLETIFQQFSQAGKINDRKTGGIGMGLTITQDIIRKHKGSIKVESTPNKGSRFAFSIPRRFS